MLFNENTDQTRPWIFSALKNQPSVSANVPPEESKSRSKQSVTPLWFSLVEVAASTSSTQGDNEPIIVKDGRKETPLTVAFMQVTYYFQPSLGKSSCTPTRQSNWISTSQFIGYEFHTFSAFHGLITSTRLQSTAFIKGQHASGHDLRECESGASITSGYLNPMFLL